MSKRTDRLYMGFDAGSQSVKVAVYTSDMTLVTSHSQAVPISYPQPGWVEMDVENYVQALFACMRKASQSICEQGYDPSQIAAIMGDGVICGIVGIDANGKAITPYINYLDTRTTADAESLAALELDIWAKETGNPVPLPMFPALFARWLLQNVPAFNESGRKFVHNAPYMLMRLANLKAQDAFVDWGTLSGWGLGYNVLRKEWSKEQLAILGINEDYLPKIVQPWQVIGHLDAAIAQEVALVPGIPILAGAGDTMQSMLGSGIFKAGQGVDVAGTCAMFCVSTKGIIPELSKPGLNLIFNSGTLPDTYFYWGFVRTGGLALRWFKDNICQQADSADYYQTLSLHAAKVEPGCNGVLFLPYLTGGIGELENASACFVNLSMADDQFVLWRSVLEGIGYDYMGLASTYRQAGVELEQITVTEGGSRDALWNQIKADMLKANIVRYTNPGGAVLTNCVLGAWAMGDIPDLVPALQAQLEVSATYSPDPQRMQLYEHLHTEREALIKSDLLAAFARLKSLRHE